MLIPRSAGEMGRQVSRRTRLAGRALLWCANHVWQGRPSGVLACGALARRRAPTLGGMAGDCAGSRGLAPLSRSLRLFSYYAISRDFSMVLG
jgi:hypothetical protein